MFWLKSPLVGHTIFHHSFLGGGVSFSAKNRPINSLAFEKNSPAATGVLPSYPQKLRESLLPGYQFIGVRACRAFQWGRWQGVQTSCLLYLEFPAPIAFFLANYTLNVFSNQKRKRALLHNFPLPLLRPCHLELPPSASHTPPAPYLLVLPPPYPHIIRLSLTLGHQI